jgi:hypothetical protein
MLHEAPSDIFPVLLVNAMGVSFTPLLLVLMLAVFHFLGYFFHILCNQIKRVKSMLIL